MEAGLKAASLVEMGNRSLEQSNFELTWDPDKPYPLLNSPEGKPAENRIRSILVSRLQQENNTSLPDVLKILNRPEIRQQQAAWQGFLDRVGGFEELMMDVRDLEEVVREAYYWTGVGRLFRS